jgi:hypothetical protein
VGPGDERKCFARDSRIRSTGPDAFFSTHGFAPTTTYQLIVDGRKYPPKAILGTACEFATGRRLGSGDFEGGTSGAGFTVQAKPRTG